MAVSKSTATQFASELQTLIRAHYPIIHISTHEEDRCLHTVRQVARDLGFSVLGWSASRGCHFIWQGSEAIDRMPEGAGVDLVTAISFFESQTTTHQRDNDGHLFVLLDPYYYLSERDIDPVHRRRLRDFAINIRTNEYRANCLIISPSPQLPSELEKEVTIIDFPLPDRAEIQNYFATFAEDFSSQHPIKTDKDPHIIEKLVDASLGLTLMEIEGALARAVLENFSFSSEDVEKIFRQKQQIIRKSGVLDYIDTGTLALSDIGGLDYLKEWLRMRAATLSPRARTFGIEAPKGVLVTGIPGCGKSWSAKCIAASWHLPLVRLDMGRVYSSLVGSSEEHMREAIRTAEAIAPCILWIDEIEKGLPSTGAYVGDSGVSLRILGKFLTWMQEKTEAVFVFATANQIDQLPPELLRKGRFDEVFFVDLPTDEERRQIIEIHLRRARRDPGRFDMAELVRLSGSQHFGDDVSLTGAEIAAWINEALILAFDRAEAELVIDDFRAVAERTVPLAQMRRDEIRSMREWASGHAVRATSLAVNHS
jgi:ATP-dependent 26S proteasome regulatory subunit